MKTFRSIAAFNCSEKTIVTLGTFDGVHLGHQKIIHKLLRNTAIENTKSVVLTFTQHPRAVLHTDSNIKLLNTNDEKAKLLEEKGVDILIIQPFESSFFNLSGEEFVKNILVDQLNIQKIIIGYDHRFGKNRSSDIHDLIQFGKKYHFDVEQISVEEINEISVSSTRIRNAINNGNIKLANDYLGYAYFFSGTVIKGKQLGRTIGYPTANIQVDDHNKILPKHGVYIVTASWDNNTYNGMMNIGVKPTVDGNNVSIEVHFFNINQDLYDKKIVVSILEFIREEQKFESLEQLKNQLLKDKTTSLSYFDNKK